MICIQCIHIYCTYYKYIHTFYLSASETTRIFQEAYICLQGNLIKSHQSPALANKAISDAVYCDTMT